MTTELDAALRRFERVLGGPGISSPCVKGADYYCPNCETDVRGISDADRVLACPICGDSPGALVLGTGPSTGPFFKEP